MMDEIEKILDAERFCRTSKAVVFDLDDTLYSEKEYVKSGFAAASPEHADELWEAFLSGKPAFDTVLPDGREEALLRYRTHTPDIHLYEGVREMLLRLRRSGKKLGIITDGRPEGQRAKLDALALPPLFDCIIITDELGGAEFRKPCDKAFIKMQETLQVPFAEMLYVGDNPKKDFIAPEKLGMQWLYFRNREGLYSK